MPQSSQDPRTEYIAGLRSFADWLEQNPQVGSPSGERMLLPLHTNPAVEEFAAAHDLTVTVDSDGNASTSLHFGPITYVVYGYADFQDYLRRREEAQAREWAERNSMTIQPCETGGAS